MSSEESDRSGHFAPEITQSIFPAFPSFPRSRAREVAHLDSAVIGHTCRGSLDHARAAMASCRWDRMSEIRQLRRRMGLSQQEYAELLSVPVETLRTWDSGRRAVPVSALHCARRAAVEHARQTELLPLGQLAAELSVHVRTLQAAARTGRLDVRFSTRSVFGRPIRLATRAAGERFKRTHYRRFAGQAICAAPLPCVPADYDQQLKHLRRRLRLTQEGLAHHVGAARRAVVYQWESRKRTPSPVFWQRIQALRQDG